MKKLTTNPIDQIYLYKSTAENALNRTGLSHDAVCPLSKISHNSMCSSLLSYIHSLSLIDLPLRPY
jgi:hypothetical protein